MSKLSYTFIQARIQAVLSKQIDRSFIEVDSRVGITVNSKAIIKTNGGASLKLFIKMNGRIIGKNPFIKIFSKANSSPFQHYGIGGIYITSVTHISIISLYR